MPGWLNTILNVLLFIVCLSTLIMIHEAGHLTAAKIFHVYCDDFSIGFGKALIHKKRKKGETYFSLRLIPFGGYVAMAGEEGELDENIKVPFNRTINGIKKWKAAIIMAAGIIMNFLVALVLLFISNAFLPQESVTVSTFSIGENSLASKAGVVGFNPEERIGDFISLEIDPQTDENGYAKWFFAYDNTFDVSNDKNVAKNYVTFSDGTKVPVVVVIYQSDTKITNPNVDSYLRFCPHKYLTKPDEKHQGAIFPNYETLYTANYSEPIKEGSKEVRTITSVTFQLNCYHRVEDENAYFSNITHENVDAKDVISKVVNDTTYYTTKDDTEFKNLGSVIRHAQKSDQIKPITLKTVKEENSDKLKYEETGIDFYKQVTRYNFGEACAQTFIDFGNGASIIYKSLGNLFVGKGWNEMGGIIAIYNQSADMVNNGGVNFFIRYWALISVNLAIFNLLPFPGLDGWQLLVLIVEGVSRRKIPDKAKTIMSYVGILLLFGLMIALIFKDITGFFK